MADENRPVKYMRYAIGEILLVVIGILIALQVNNWNEERIERQQIEKYARSLIKDLESDIDMMEVSMFQAAKNYKAIDSLRSYIAETEPKDLSNTVLFILTNDVIYRPYEWNRSTFEALKGSGSLRFITNDSLGKKLVAYETFSKHLDEDFKADMVNAEKANDLIATMLRLNSKNLLKIDNWIVDHFNSPFQIIFKSPEFIEAKANDLTLSSYDKQDLNHMVNRFILIQNNYRVRAFLEMPKIIKDAKAIISLLKNEYGVQA